jgi:hypothetical protein
MAACQVQPNPFAITVLLVKKEDGSWGAFFCTKADATAREILEAIASHG